MDILVPDSWLKDYLETEASPEEIAKDLSLSGPSVEKIIKNKGEDVYAIEVTTNRVDTASVYGIAREASAILPRFDIKANLNPITIKSKANFKNTVDYLTVDVDTDLCSRFSAVLIKDVVIKDSPDWMKKRLEMVGVRPISNVVDISNYIMHALGQPIHTFDYDKITDHKMILRKSKKGEVMVTLDGKEHNLPGNDIVIEDGSGRIIDLAGIMGGENSAIDDKTKNVLLFVQTYNPRNIRRTSMALAQRTEAASLFEKDLDPEMVETAMMFGIDLFKDLTEGQAMPDVLDIYPKPYKEKVIKVDLDFINKILGAKLTTAEVESYLKPLGFGIKVTGKSLTITVPSYRAIDVNIKEDIAEEVARIYGYYNLPSQLMTGSIPEPLENSPFDFEYRIKTLLSGWGGTEIFTLTLVPQDFAEENALRIKNPMGKDTEYLRNSMIPSLVSAADDNKGNTERFHLFEISNIYLQRKSTLPNEVSMISGIMHNHSYRAGKGIVEALLQTLKVDYDFTVQDKKHFLPSHRLSVKSGNKEIGQLGILEKGNYFYYEFSIDQLMKAAGSKSVITELSKYPPQIEDVTISFPERTQIGEVIISIKSVSKLISDVLLKDIYNNAYTFTIYYQNPQKTLTDNEVKDIRDKILSEIKNRHSGIPKV